MERARRLENLTSAIFAEIDLLKAKVAKTGKEIINLGIGSPDQPPAKHVQEALLKGVQNLNNYGYPTSRGLSLLRETITHWYKKDLA